MRTAGAKGLGAEHGASTQSQRAPERVVLRLEGRNLTIELQRTTVQRRTRLTEDFKVFLRTVGNGGTGRCTGGLWAQKVGDRRPYHFKDMMVGLTCIYSQFIVLRTRDGRVEKEKGARRTIGVGGRSGRTKWTRESDDRRSQCRHWT